MPAANRDNGYKLLAHYLQSQEGLSLAGAPLAIDVLKDSALLRAVYLTGYSAPTKCQGITAILAFGVETTGESNARAFVVAGLSRGASTLRLQSTVHY